MKTISLEVNVPSDLLLLLRVSEQELAQEVQHWIALELFRSRKISAGKAAEVAGVSLSEFMDITRQHEIAWVDYTDKELEAELREATILGNALKTDEGYLKRSDFFALAGLWQDRDINLESIHQKAWQNRSYK